MFKAFFLSWENDKWSNCLCLSHNASKDLRPTPPHLRRLTGPPLTPSSLWSQDDMAIKLPDALKRKKEILHELFNKGSTKDPEKNEMRQRSWKQREDKDKTNQEHRMLDVSPLSGLSQVNGQDRMAQLRRGAGQRQWGSGRETPKCTEAYKELAAEGKVSPLLMATIGWSHSLPMCGDPSYYD